MPDKQTDRQTDRHSQTDTRRVSVVSLIMLSLSDISEDSWSCSGLVMPHTVLVMSQMHAKPVLTSSHL